MSRERLDVRTEGGGRSLWQRMKDLALTDVGALVRGIDREAVADLERLLLEGDFGVDAATELVDELERAARRGEIHTERELRELLGRRIRGLLAAAREDGGPGPDGWLAAPAGGPGVVLILGVNGTGKTTTAGKLAAAAADRGESVLLAATDTFRTGAREQLRIWAERVGAGFVGGEPGGDPAAVAYDAVESAVSRDVDRVILDTAGRLHTRRDLMDELLKVDRVAGRLVEGAPHERILVVDATSGRNVVSQARRFGDALSLTGTVLAKFDSTGRGGSAVAVVRELGVPVRFLGVGEGPGDLETFDPDRYVESLLAG